MGGHFWEASLFKGLKGGHPSQKINFFFDILLVNRWIGIVSMAHFNILIYKGVSGRSKVARGPKDPPRH